MAILIGSVKSRIQIYYLKKAKNRWRNLDKCKFAKETWPTYSEKHTTQLIDYKRRHLVTNTLFTGRWMIGKHASRLDLPYQCWQILFLVNPKFKKKKSQKNPKKKKNTIYNSKQLNFIVFKKIFVLCIKRDLFWMSIST